MKTINKLIAAISAISLVAVSFASMVTATAAETPTVTAEVITGDELIAVDDGAESYDIGLKISFTNFEKSLKSVTFNLKVPSDIQAQNKKGVGADFTAANLKNYSIYYDNSAFDDGWGNTTVADDYGEGWTRAYISWLNWADGGSAVYFDTADSNYFVISLRVPSEDYVLPEGAFKISDLQVAYNDAISPLENVTLVDPTTSTDDGDDDDDDTTTITQDTVTYNAENDAAVWAWTEATAAGNALKVNATMGSETTPREKTFALPNIEANVKIGIIVQYNPTDISGVTINSMEVVTAE